MKALSNAIQLAEQMGVRRAVFEADCLNLKSAMNSSEQDLSPICILISDMAFRLRVGFIDASVVYTPRGCNRLAHELAALGVGLAPVEQMVSTLSDLMSVTHLMTDDMAVS